MRENNSIDSKGDTLKKMSLLGSLILKLNVFVNELSWSKEKIKEQALRM